MKIGVISHSQNPTSRPERYISKNAAAALIRRLIAVRITRSLIQMVEPRAMVKALPAQMVLVPRKPKPYQHHIEPRFCEINAIEQEVADMYVRAAFRGRGI